MDASICVDEITKFMIEDGGGEYSWVDYPILRDAIEKHLEYKTIIVVDDDIGVLAVCRWEMTHDGLVAYIINLTIRKGKRTKKLIKNILSYGLSMFPEAELIHWKRGLKYPGKQDSLYIIDDILKRRN